MTRMIADITQIAPENILALVVSLNYQTTLLFQNLIEQRLHLHQMQVH